MRSCNTDCHSAQQIVTHPRLTTVVMVLGIVPVSPLQQDDHQLCEERVRTGNTVGPNVKKSNIARP